MDETPTTTRMFTFSPHLQCLLLIHFLQIPDQLLRVRSGNPRERNRKRLDKVKAFFSLPDSVQYLKRSVLALHILEHVQSIWKQASSEPLMVQLARGRVSQTVSGDFSNYRNIKFLFRNRLLDCV